MSKITVYLDSDDYSKLSNPVELERNPKLVSTLNELNLLVTNNDIEVRYSALNVGELVHISDDSKLFAVKRAQLLKSLSCGKAFIRPDLLKLYEAIHLANCDADISFAKSFDWSGFETSVAIEDVGSLLEDDFHAILKEHTSLGRNERRQLKKKIITTSGKLTSYGINLCIPYWKSNNRIPDFPIFEEAIIDYYCGKISKLDLNNSVTGVLNDVEELVVKTLDYIPEKRMEFISFIRNLGLSLNNSIPELQNLMINLEQAYPELHKDKQITKQFYAGIKKSVFDAVYKARFSILNRMFVDNEQIIRKAHIGSKLWQEKVVNSKFGHLPALDTLLSLMAQSGYNKLVDKSQPELNDYRDFYHACYAPYCDIFRADKRTAELIRSISNKIPNLQNTIIVKKPEFLISAIMERNKGLNE